MGIRDDMNFIYRDVPQLWSEIARNVLTDTPDDTTYMRACELRRMIFGFKDYGWTEVHSMYIPLLTRYIKDYRERGQRDMSMAIFESFMGDTTCTTTVPVEETQETEHLPSGQTPTTLRQTLDEWEADYRAWFELRSPHKPSTSEDGS